MAAGAPGHGSIHLLVSCAASVGFVWLPDLCIWQRPGLPALCRLLQSIPVVQGFDLGRLGRLMFPAILVLGLVFRGWSAA